MWKIMHNPWWDFFLQSGWTLFVLGGCAFVLAATLHAMSIKERESFGITIHNSVMNIVQIKGRLGIKGQYPNTNVFNTQFKKR